MANQQSKNTSVNYSKSGYEIRQQLLQQAQDILAHKYHALVERATRTATQFSESPPTTEDIIVEAEKLYDFVKRK